MTLPEDRKLSAEQARWLADNAEAMEDCNRRVDTEGVFSDSSGVLNADESPPEAGIADDVWRSAKEDGGC
jgi:Post-segregation antitoxin CcdA